MSTTGIDTPVATVLQQHAGKSENHFNKLPVSVGRKSMVCQLFRRPLLLVAECRLLRLVEEYITREFTSLGALIQLVGGTKMFEDAVKSIQERYPVIQVTSSEGPSGWETGKMLWQEG